MEERKHIDRLYQEKFKDFEAAPREAAWKNISARLEDKKRKRRVIPLWYKIAGVAAVLALFINFASGLFKNNTASLAHASTDATQAESDFGNFTLASQEYTENMLRSSVLLHALMLDTQQELTAQTIQKSSRKKPSEVKYYAGIIELPNTTKFKGINREAYTFSDFSQLASNENKDLKEETLLNNDLIVEGLDKDLAEDDEVILVSSLPEKRIKISTVAAPIYFNNLGSGNSIDAKFANNESSSEVSMAYGINFAYVISEKIKIRSGISKVGMSRNTQHIAYTAAVNPIALAAVNYAGDIPNYRIENRTVGRFSNLTASTEFNRSSLASPAAGYLNQKLGFIEVPLEFEYTLIDKKISLNLIGGGSTLFLDENVISLNSNNFSAELGAANNLNNVSFTGNFGLGLDYDISSKFELNIEPILKYQFNTFDNSTGGVNSYYFGVYSGFSFKF